MIAAVTDIGGSNVRVALISADGQIIDSRQWPVDRNLSAREHARHIVDALWALADQHEIARESIAGFGASVAGELDTERGFIHDSVNLGWRDVPLADWLHEFSGKRAWIEMDAHAAALGEAWRGAGRGMQHFILLIVGTGIGAGLILNGRPYRGAGGLAGEFGHTTIQVDGPLCNCGRYGCLEAFASGVAIEKAAHAAVLRGEPTMLAASEKLSTADVFRAARAGDECALGIVDRAAHYLGVGVTNLFHGLSPELIVMSGGVALNGGDLLLPRVRAEVRRQLGYWARRAPCRLELSTLGDTSGLYGGARRVFEEVQP